MSDKSIGGNNISSKVVLKSGLWYTISNFAFRAIAFITTPIFARVLTKAEYGDFNNISSWISILGILAACDLHSSIIRAKLDFDDDLECYSFSSLLLSTLITGTVYLVFLINSSFFEGLLGINKKYFHVIFLYIACQEAFNTYITLQRANYRYKAFSLLTGISIVFTSVTSVILVLVLDNKLDARIYGQYIPLIIVGLCMYLMVAGKGRHAKAKYFKYAFTLSIPLVPHQLSLILLSSSDRIMITRLAGSEFTALYSIAYIITNIMAILMDSMNKAWAPWLLTSLKAKNYEAIKKTTTPYFYLFFALLVGALIFAPEVVFVLGGAKYMEGIYVLPPLIVGCLFQFAYTMYVQMEFYEKKMSVVAIGSSVAALINIALNLLLIPRLGYIAAGYTTLIGYVCLFFIHYTTICRYGYKNIFDRKYIFIGLAAATVLIPVFVFLYSFPILRYLIGAVYIVLILAALLRYREKIASFLKSR